MRIIRRLKYINHYRDRHGRQRYYFRRGREPQVALPGAPGSPEFMTAYQEALKKTPRPRIVGEDRSPLGSLSAVIAGYYRHHSWVGLATATQQARRGILEKFRGDHGGKSIATLKREHLEAILGELKPFAQHNWLKTLRGLMQFAVAAGLRKDDPTASIAKAKAEAGSIHTWTEAEIAQYLACHAKFSPAWNALVTTLCTGQRGSDVIRMGPQHVEGERLYVKQQKTGTEILIPIHPLLRALIDEHLRSFPEGVVELHPRPFVTKRGGGGYTKRTSFTNQFRVWCDEAGLPKACSPHGLRKAMCRRLAEAGCSAMEIMAITGHKTLAEVERYVREARQATLASNAMRRVEGL